MKPTARRIGTRDPRVIGRKKAIQRKRERERERGRGREDANGFFMPVKGRVCNVAHVECSIDGSENALSLAIASRSSVCVCVRARTCVLAILSRASSVVRARPSAFLERCHSEYKTKRHANRNAAYDNEFLK